MAVILGRRVAVGEVDVPGVNKSAEGQLTEPRGERLDENDVLGREEKLIAGVMIGRAELESGLLLTEDEGNGGIELFDALALPEIEYDALWRGVKLAFQLLVNSGETSPAVLAAPIWLAAKAREGTGVRRAGEATGQFDGSGDTSSQFGRTVGVTDRLDADVTLGETESPGGIEIFGGGNSEMATIDGKALAENDGVVEKLGWSDRGGGIEIRTGGSNETGATDGNTFKLELDSLPDSGTPLERCEDEGVQIVVPTGKSSEY